MFELKGCYAFPDVNRDVVRNVSRAVCVRYLRTIGPLTIIKGLVRDITYFMAPSNNWFSSFASQARLCSHAEIGRNRVSACEFTSLSVNGK